MRGWHYMGMMINFGFLGGLIFYRFICIREERFLQQNIFVIVWLPLELVMKGVMEPVHLLKDIVCTPDDPSSNSFKKESAINAEGGEDMPHEKSEKLQQYEEHLADKSKVMLKEDFTTLTVLCFMTENVEKHMIVEEKRSQMLWSAVTSQIFVSLMLACMAYAIFVNENSEYPISQPHNFFLMLIKAPTILALHFLLSPEVENGMRIMKFANQQVDQFVEGGSEVAFILGFVQCAQAFGTTLVCLRLLAFQHSIQHSIIHFVALEMIMEFGVLYFESQSHIGNKLTTLCHHHPVAKNKGADIVWADRSCFHKCARVLYRILRLYYISCIFYMLPFWMYFILFNSEGGDPARSHGHH